MKKTTLFIWIVVILLIAGYAVITMNAPVRVLNELRKEIQADSVYKVKDEQTLQLGELSQLLNDKAGKESRLKLAQLDSIGLYINLADSTVSLMLKNMILRSSKIESFNCDKFFGSIDQATKSVVFSSPIEIKRQECNVEKRPYIYKEAPADTSEAPSGIVYTDTTKNVAISLKLSLDHDFIFYLLANNDNDFSKKSHNYKAIAKEKVNTFITNIKKIVKGEKIPYYPSTTMYLDSEDIVNIYRAIPNKAYVIITFPESPQK